MIPPRPSCSRGRYEPSSGAPRRALIPALSAASTARSQSRDDPVASAAGKTHERLRTARISTQLAPASRAQSRGALDEWVVYYNTARPHQALGDAAPETRFQRIGDLRRACAPSESMIRG